MLGRTHMAIGALGAVAAYPIIEHVRWDAVENILHSASAGMSHTIASEATIVLSAVVASVMPDLDQPNSMMAHRVERIGQVTVIAVLLAFVFLMHLSGSLTAWTFVIALGWLSSTPGNAARLAGLGVIGVVIIALGIHHDMTPNAAVVLTIWVIGAMFTHHRTFTHSLLGLVLFAMGVNLGLKELSHLHLVLVSDGLILGYALHLAADAVAGGVPLLWPVKHRQGIRLVRTGSMTDHLIGGIATLVFLGFAVL
ncbi:metal-dependent hydrolase [Alicyclobacillus mengziensis]|uniref:Metal-dependent hydrolase n=1 Tax=Alicyclobacillus mengziensis TaxID=2931921 RepID=A0A9X7VY35_9BACL|nr:metal-dependent hydrolase [Alicyclobacillus mengziensis]QSO47201.1 metal-dependent hydrolase [Alicyclobacillus mengziensis]